MTKKQRYYIKEKTYFLTTVFGETGHLYAIHTYIHLDTTLHPFKRVNTKHIIDVNIKSKAIKCLKRVPPSGKKSMS